MEIKRMYTQRRTSARDRLAISREISSHYWTLRNPATDPEIGTAASLRVQLFSTFALPPPPPPLPLHPWKTNKQTKTRMLHDLPVLKHCRRWAIVQSSCAKQDYDINASPCSHSLQQFCRKSSQQKNTSSFDNPVPSRFCTLTWPKPVLDSRDQGAIHFDGPVRRCGDLSAVLTFGTP